MSDITEWVDFHQKNKPQSNAVAGGIILMLVSGIQVGWIFNNEMTSFPWAKGHSTLQLTFTYVSFYIAAIAGLYLAAMTINRLTKKNIYVSLLDVKTFRRYLITLLTFSVLGSDVWLFWLSLYNCNAKVSFSVDVVAVSDRYCTWLRLPHRDRSRIRNNDAKASRDDHCGIEFLHRQLCFHVW